MRKNKESWKGHIARNFNKAAARYEAHSPIQKKSAEALAALIANSAPDSVGDILEFGCGTGYLTRALYPTFTSAHWVISDISPHMVSTCMQSMPDSPKLTYCVMDAEELTREERFDLICSNLTAQWFTDTKKSVHSLISHLKPGGLLALSTLGPNTFTLWQESFREMGTAPVMPVYPDSEEWRYMLENHGLVQINTEIRTYEYGSAFDFARALKDIGAHGHSGGAAHLNPGTVRSILRTFDAHHDGKAVQADYDIITILFRKPTT